MPAQGTLAVRGLSDLTRAFALADVKLKKELRDTLREVAEPVRIDAEFLAVAGIRNIGVPWSQMRVGVTSKVVYVAPRQRGTKTRSRKRPNLADRLMNTAMQPALDRNQDKVSDGVGRLLDEIGRDWQRV